MLRRVIFLCAVLCCSTSLIQAQDPPESPDATAEVDAKRYGPNIVIGDSTIKAFDFVGGGDLNSIAQNGEGMTAGNISVGLYYLREFPQNAVLKDLEIDFGINISSTVDSFNFGSQRAFGNYLLNPINTRQSARLDMYSLFEQKEKTDSVTGKTKETIPSIIFDGIFLRFYGSNANWTYRDEDVSVTALHFKAGLFHEFLPDNVARSSNSSIMLGVALGMRAATGDIRSNNSALLKEILGTSKGTYWGVDAMFGVKFNNIRAEFIIPFIFKNDQTSVLGLTDTQFMTQVRFIGGFPLRLQSDEAIKKSVDTQMAKMGM